ncbi:hypothetical protein GCM10010405_43440 [Streptomyces macrosporus]|uniref:Uncharacterized protein n=1 Tax=Streptomyces macrosporus TaxID=44032 RepID=A0ABP5XL91_9ACTN
MDFAIPKHGGRVRRAQPPASTQTMAANSVSSGVSWVPPPCGRTFDGGISGLAISHGPSGAIRLHRLLPHAGRRADRHMGHALVKPAKW